ncbi:endoplasmic reticulum-Golgi intermediate compartment protein 3-like isoform X1 [Senna tora]|uniref:Endoplasmic reticulum-Golgi intermediate compartment protein 3-like isoform X1 n=1 Tax=Senna tora TaxID=362788 RepID=A0A834TWL2_9FABA|nr:endoplasmic reticulum-Golgi intermediate compartment protein 3-like isoform X1 [Senna tora]
MDSIMTKLRNLDAYPKINEDFYSRTLSGGLITIASSILMLLLFISELRTPPSTLTSFLFIFCFISHFCLSGMNLCSGLYLHAATETKLVVDTSRGETLRINVMSFDLLLKVQFDVTFPALPCSILSLDAMDISGEQHLDVKHDIVKKRLDSHGNVIETRQDGIGSPKIEKPLQRHGGRLEHNETYCGSCYGAEATDEDCCNSCEDVREAYRKKGWAISNPDVIDQCKREGFLQRIKDEEGEGCNVYGFLEVNKVAGNFHFAPGKSFQQSGVHVHDLLAFQKDSFNISHHINRLAFGDYFPGVVNPLDGVHWTQQAPSGMYQYFIKVVPTVYTDVNGHTIQSNQFSVTEHFRTGDVGRLLSLPGVFFFYDLSPIKVTFTEEHISFLHFLTNVCAIVGGVFTVSGILDSFVYHGQKAIKKKMELGKFS